MKITKEIIQEREWALQDLLHVKHTKMYNEYVTAENIDEWISKQATEIRFMKELYEIQQGEKE